MRGVLRIVCVLGVALAWTGAAQAATFTVTTITDGANGSCAATCTLRDAIVAANASAGADTITFAADGWFYFNSPVPAVTGPVTIDGTTAPSYASTPTVTLLGGLVLNASGITVKAVEVKITAGFGFYIAPPGGDVVQGSVVDAIVGYGFPDGIVIVDSSGNEIGGTGAGQGNTIVDQDFGIVIAGSSSGNHVEGNLVHNDGDGIWVQSPSNVIGGTAPAAGNTVQGDIYHGIVIVGPAPGNVIQGNLVGSLDGTAAKRNGLSGILVAAPSTLIGGTSPGARNVVSGNAFNAYTNGAGILVVTSGNTIQGNYVGTDVPGTSDAKNFGSGINDLGGGNTIGGTAPGARNLISNGITIHAPGDTIQGNYVGLDASGTAAIPYGGGVVVAASSTTIGGTAPGAGNVVSGNNGVGISVDGSKNVIQGNLVGTTADGSTALPNGTLGLLTQVGGIQISGSSYLVGGVSPEARNIVSGNNGVGIGAFGNKGVVTGNYVGTDITGTTALPNTGNGMVLGGPSVTLGGSAAGAGNVISGNGGSGIYLAGNGSKSKNLIQGNRIGTTADGTTALGNSEDGIRIWGASGNTIGGTVPEAGNLISGNGQYGINVLYIAGTTKNLVEGNRIGTNATGTTALGNLEGGVLLDAVGTTIGGAKPGMGNVISGNGGLGGILVFSGGNSIYGNLIGTQADGATPLGNAQNGVFVEAPGPMGPIGGVKQGMSNVIAFNGQAGVDVLSGTAGGIFGNSFFANSGLGIDLGGDGPTPNDPFDTDAGPDGLQNFPVLNAPAIVNGKLMISGTLSSAPGTYKIYLYSNLPTDAAPQGRTVIGTVKKVKVASSGDGTFAYNTVLLPAGTQITAVATDSSGGTSELSAPVTV